MTGTAHRSSTPDFLAGGGATGALMRAHDWSNTPLGVPGSWPPALRPLVAVMLGADQPIFIAWGAERTFLYNDACGILLGHTLPPALGRSFAVVWADVGDEVGTLVNRGYAGQATYSDDLALTLLRDGHREEVHMALSCTPVHDKAGRVAGVFCPFIVTTGRVLAERRQAFRLDFEGRLRDLTDPKAVMAAAAQALGSHLGAAQSGCAVFDAAGRVTADAAYRDRRTPGAVGTRRRIDDFGPGIVAGLVKDLRTGRTVAVEDVERDAGSAAAEVLVTCRAMSVRALLAVPLVRDGRLVSSLYAMQHQPRSWTRQDIGLMHEVAESTWAAVERVRAHAALREREVRFRNMADNAPVMIWVTEPDGRCSYLNRAWYAFTGQTPETGLGDGWLEAVHSDDREATDRAFREANARQDHYRLEFRLRRSDGEWRWAIDAAAPRFADDRTFLGYIGSVIDITERKRAEVALQRAKGEAEQADLAKSKFLAVASHDLRQPLQSLLLFLEVLKPHVMPTGRDALAHVSRGLDALRDLLDGLLDISRLDAGVVQASLGDFPIQALLGPMADAYRPVAAAKGLEFRAGPCAAVVCSDRLLLERLLRNLIENALRYTEAGWIAIRCHAGERSLRIEVHDTGIGIPPEHLERIWEEFHQVGSPEPDRNRGLGLGLAIVQRLSGLLGHPVAVRSAPGRGSVFSVEVPLGGHDARPAAGTPNGEAGTG